MLLERVTAEATHSWLVVISRLLSYAPTIDCYPDIPVHRGSELVMDQGYGILLVPPGSQSLSFSISPSRGSFTDPPLDRQTPWSNAERVLCPCDPVTRAAQCLLSHLPDDINSSSLSRRALCAEENLKKQKKPQAQLPFFGHYSRTFPKWELWSF